VSKHGQKPSRKETAFREAISRARLETADLGLSFDPPPVTQPLAPPADADAPVPQPAPAPLPAPRPVILVRADTERARFEYRLERAKGSRRRLEKRLRRLGRKGWELVAVERGTAFLRRRAS
jgi:hypothetical protein